MSKLLSSSISQGKNSTSEPVWIRFGLITLALTFMFLFLVLPLAAVFGEALRKGFDAYWSALQEPDAWYAIRLTLFVALDRKSVV